MPMWNPATSAFLNCSSNGVLTKPRLWHENGRYWALKRCPATIRHARTEGEAENAKRYSERSFERPLFSLEDTMAIKLVIFDLDETLWKGVLSESDVEWFPERIPLLNSLVDRGIVLSISSKNDRDQVMAWLERSQVSDLFISPRINWESKGGQIQQIISDLQFRDEDVLFVDDNPMNRGEAIHSCPNLKVLDPAAPEFSSVMSKILAEGKDDHKRTRLKQYKILEERLKDRETANSNDDFLRSCDIHVSLVPAAGGDLSRVNELINRTNQLNFTKKRCSLEEIASLLANPGVSNTLVHVRDRYGDYGAVGFVSQTSSEVTHFCFSCRTMHMGLESWVKFRLNVGELNIVPPVAYPISEVIPDWILEDAHDSPRKKGEPRRRLLMIGGCDLGAISHVLESHWNVTERFHYPASDSRVLIRPDSIDLLLTPSFSEAERSFITDSTYFIDQDSLSPPNFSAFDDLVYSPMIDYKHRTFVSKRLPGYYVGTEEKTKPLFEGNPSKWSAQAQLSEERITRFQDSWTEADKPDAVYEDQLTELFKRMSIISGRIFVIVPPTSTHSELDKDLGEVHSRMNAILTRVIAKYEKVVPIFVDELTKSRSHFTDSIRHWSKIVYLGAGAKIVRYGGSERGVSIFSKTGDLGLAVAEAGQLWSSLMKMLSRGFVSLVRWFLKSPAGAITGVRFVYRSLKSARENRRL